MKRSRIMFTVRFASFLVLAPILFVAALRISGPARAVAASGFSMHRAAATTGIADALNRGELPASHRLLDNASIAARFTRLELRLPVLEALLAQCHKRGIPTQYETVDYTTIQHFIPWGREDLNGHPDDAVHIAAGVEQLYGEATANLRAYLAGSKHALAAPEYLTQHARISGYFFLGDMRWPDGRIEHHRPIFYTGYGFFSQAANDLPYFTGYGTNIVQLDGAGMGQHGGPNAVIYPVGTLDWPLRDSHQAQARFRIDPTVAHAGTQSLQISNVGGDTNSGMASLPLVVEPHTTYLVTAWVKGRNVSHVDLLTGEDAPLRADDPGRTVHPLPDGTYDWRKVEFTVNTGPEILWGLAIRTAGATDALWLDDIRVSKAGSAANLIPDPGFEAIPMHTATGYYASPTMLKAELVPLLAVAARHNIAVDLLLSPHEFPAFAYAKWPEMVEDSRGFLGYNVLDPHAKAILDAYLRTLMPLIKDAPALHSICLTNEPSYRPKGDTADQQAWHAYLQETYGDVQRLNATYGAQYATVAEVPDKPSQLAGQYDWQRFTEQRFAGWHHHLADIIHQMAPRIPIHTKIVPGDDDGYKGVDPARFAAFSQISGLDNWPGLSFRYLGNYDAFGSLKTMPIFNSEDHIVSGSAAGVRTALWQGAIHGRSASTLWYWERHGEDNLLQEPEVVATVGKTALDLNRLAPEITALHAAPASTAIYWSLLSPPTEHRWLHIYSILTQRGQHVDFITDQQIAAGKLSRYKLLILPAGAPMARAALPALQQFVDKGGSITAVDTAAGDSFLASDDHAQPLPAEIRAHILERAVYVHRLPGGLLDPTPVLQQLDTLGLTRVQLIDPATHQPVTANDAITADNEGEEKGGGGIAGWEWRAVQYGDRLLVDVVAYADQEQTVSLVVDGQQVKRATDLISGETMAGPIFHVQGLTPYLFELPPSVRLR